MHKIVSTIIVHLKASELMARRIARPNWIASKLKIVNRTARAHATVPSSFRRGYPSALFTAITIVNGNGGGAMHPTATAAPPFSPIFFFKYSYRLCPATFCTPASPLLRATRSSRNTPSVEPHTADTTYSGHPW